MNLRPLPRKRLVAYAHRGAFAPWSLRILAKLGYEIQLAEELDALASASTLQTQRPDLWIADERRVAEVPDDAESRGIPLVVLTGRTGAVGGNPRVAAAVRRPAGLHDLYRVFQELREDRPRGALRVATHLPARCRQDDREWTGSVVSLSENGCLLRSGEALPLGSHLDIEFPLPKVGLVETEAEAAYQLPPDLGLVFHATTSEARTAISEYVIDALSALSAPSAE
jgi:hypothetical protein